MNNIKKQIKRENKYRYVLRQYVVYSGFNSHSEKVKLELLPKPYATGRIKKIRKRILIPLIRNKKRTKTNRIINTKIFILYLHITRWNRH